MRKTIEWNLLRMMKFIKFTFIKCGEVLSILLGQNFMNLVFKL